MDRNRDVAMMVRLRIYNVLLLSSDTREVRASFQLEVRGARIQ
jgi:hypothetical protein